MALPADDDDLRYRMKDIGEYDLRQPEVMHGNDGEAIAVHPAAYPVIGATSMDGQRISEGGTIFHGKTAQGEDRTVVEFHSAAELRRLAQDGTIKLAEGVDQSMIQARSQVVEQKQSVGLRR